MNDMRAVIVPKSDQTNADDLLTGPITITIREVSIRPGAEQPVSIHYVNDNDKPWKPCKSMSRVLVRCWGPDATQYVGRSLTLYCDPKVKWGGLAVGGIRISHMSHIDDTMVMALTETKGSKKPFTVKPLAVEATPATNGPKKISVAEWLDALERRREAVQNDEQGAALIAGKDVQKALATFQNGELARVKAIVESLAVKIAERAEVMAIAGVDVTENDTPDLMSDLAATGDNDTLTFLSHQLKACRTPGAVTKLQDDPTTKAKVRDLGPTAADEWASRVTAALAEARSR